MVMHRCEWWTLSRICATRWALIAWASGRSAAICVRLSGRCVCSLAWCQCRRIHKSYCAQCDEGEPRSKWTHRIIGVFDCLVFDWGLCEWVWCIWMGSRLCLYRTHGRLYSCQTHAYHDCGVFASTKARTTRISITWVTFDAEDIGSSLGVRAKLFRFIGKKRTQEWSKIKPNCRDSCIIKDHRVLKRGLGSTNSIMEEITSDSLP